jgi:hypothetical protein
MLPGLLSDSLHPNLIAFVVVYGLDWVATVPPTAALCREAFGEAGSVVFGWVFAAHQIGAAHRLRRRRGHPRHDRPVHDGLGRGGLPVPGRRPRLDPGRAGRRAGQPLTRAHGEAADEAVQEQVEHERDRDRDQDGRGLERLPEEER